MHSVYRPGTVLTGNYWDEFLVDPLAALGRPPRSLAILGDGAGTMVRAYGHYFPATQIDAVEIDGELTAARQALLRAARAPGRALPRRRTRGRSCAARTRASTRSSSTPTASRTSRSTSPRASSSGSCATGSTPAASVVVNVGHPDTLDAARARADARRCAPCSRTSSRDPVRATSTRSCSGRPTEPSPSAALPPRRASLPADLRPVAPRRAARLARRPARRRRLHGRPAPVEWLIDASIVDYAAGAR